MIIVVEGINGAGKQTQIDIIQHWLEQEGKKTQVFHDPGVSDDHPCQELRKAFIYGDKWGDALVCLLIGAAARRLLNNEIRKFLKDNPAGILILDRYEWSTYVYQTLMLERGGYSEKDAQELVTTLGRMIDCEVPDVVVYLDVKPETAYARRGGGKRRNVNDEGRDDQFEAQGMALSRKLHRRYEDVRRSWEEHKYSFGHLAKKVIRAVESSADHTPSVIFDGYKKELARALGIQILESLEKSPAEEPPVLKIA